MLKQKGVSSQEDDFHSKNYAITGMRAKAAALWAVCAKEPYFKKPLLKLAYAGAQMRHLQAEFPTLMSQQKGSRVDQMTLTQRFSATSS